MLLDVLKLALYFACRLCTRITLINLATIWQGFCKELREGQGENNLSFGDSVVEL